MRNIVITGWVLSALLMAGCDEKSSGSNATPSQSASANSSAVPAGSGSAAASASAKAEPPKPKVEGPKDFATRVKALDEAFAAHDATKLAALYTDDALIKTPGQPDVKGKDAIAKDFERLFGIFKDAKLTHGRVWEKDKHLALVESIFTGTNTGDAPEMGLPKATNKAVGISGAAWLSVDDDGLIKEEHRYHDGGSLMSQLVPDKKNPTRPAVTAPPDGTTLYKAKEERDVREAKDPTLKNEIEKSIELQRKNMELENKFAVSFSSNKLDESMKLVGDEMVVTDYRAPADVKGKKAFKDFLGTFLTAFPDVKGKITSIFGDGDYVVVEFDYTGTQKGPLGALKPTNKPIDMHQIEVDVIKDNKFVRAWVWGNGVELLGELGLLPTPGAPPAAPPGAPSAAPSSSAKPTSTVK
jgi:steroid delta-isomerase-like uncharacterized protein